MRQTLIRFVPGEFWSVESADNVLFLGAGFAALPFVLFSLCWLLQTLRVRKLSVTDLPLALILLVIMSGLVVVVQSLPSAVEGLPVRGYGLMICLGVLFASWNASRRARSVGWDPKVVMDIAIWILLFGIIGGRVFYICRYSNRVLAGRQGIDAVWAAVNLADGGLVLYGGVILGAVVFLVFCHRHRLTPLLMADIVMPSVFIGLAFGRLGCFMNGCCFGDRCDLPWAATFPRSSATFDALVANGLLDTTASTTFAIHPTQIYSAINAGILAIITATYFRYRSRDGEVLMLGMIVYPVTRFVLEILRGDEPYAIITTAQWVNMLLLVSGIAYGLWLSRQPKVLTPRIPFPIPTATTASPGVVKSL